MNEPNQRQLEINFDGRPDEHGFRQWQEQRRLAMQKLARKMGLPLGHNVEVWLRSGIRLRGLLQLLEQRLWVEEKRDFSLELLVDAVSFTAAEIESCVRMD